MLLVHCLPPCYEEGIALTEWHGHKVTGRLGANALLLELNATNCYRESLCFRAQNQNSQLICSEQSGEGQTCSCSHFSLCVYQV